VILVCPLATRMHNTIRHDTSLAVLGRLMHTERGGWGRLRTAVRIIHSIVGHVDGASIQHALWLNSGWDATRDVRPYRQGFGIIEKHSRRLP
jgi:hypothetical protein